MIKAEEMASTYLRTLAESLLLGDLASAGVDPFKTKMHFRLNKLRKEIKMDSKKEISEYIKHLEKARDGIEKEQDKLLTPFPASSRDTNKMARLESEFTTLGIVIKDLRRMPNVREFSYWDVS